MSILKQMRILILFLVFSWFHQDLSSQAPKVALESTLVAIPFSEGISTDDLKQHLNTLASDEFEGRETGTPGQKKAAQYLARQFKKLGLPAIGQNKDYFQKISFISETWKDITFTVNDTSIQKHLRNYYAYPSTNPSLTETLKSEEIIFLGYGIDAPNYSDYAKVDVRGKTILVYDGEPITQDSIYQITGNKEPSDWTTDSYIKLLTARAKGVKHLIIIDRDFRNRVGQARRQILNRSLRYGESGTAKEKYLPNTFITSEVAKAIIGSKLKKVIKSREKSDRKGKPKPVLLDGKVELAQEKNTRSLVGENVLGYIEGSDPQLKEEVVIVTAHYDHLGKRGDAVYNGADDNASGTSTVLEISQAFAEARKAGVGPKRSVLTMLVSGEEKGLLGSAYYADHPIFPLNQTVANINIDMVGRVDEAHAGNPDYIYVIGSDRLSTTLHEINELANSTYTKLELDYTYNAEDDPNRYYYRSDHYNFAEKGIPAIFYFNGTHDDYHRTSDTPEKIQFDKMEKIAKLAFFTAWELANRNEKIKVDVK